ncbi:MAG: carbamoyltransferase C-terminal domain-containing protein [Pseudonocardia sp.]
MARRKNTESAVDYDDGWTLGLGGSTHGFSAALAQGPDIRVAIEEERLSRVKYGFGNWFDDPTSRCVRYCLDAEGIKQADLNAVVSSDLFPYRAREFYSDLEFTTYPHHLTHAASACVMLPPAQQAAVIVYDGVGSARDVIPRNGQRRTQRETFSFFRFEENRLELLGTTYGEGFSEDTDYGDGFTNSLGLFYEIVSVLLGFGQYEAGKTMGLSAWGEPRYIDQLMPFFCLGKHYEKVLSFDPFGEFPSLVRDILDVGRGEFEVRADLAATAQEIVNRVLLHCVERLAGQDYDVLCLVGGCALNAVANGVLATALPNGRRLLVPPYPHDAGLALGALWLHQRGREMTFLGGPAAPMLSRPGRAYREADVHRAALRHYPQVVHDPSADTPEDVADLLCTGEVIGVFQGRSEFGPRALGGRSILTDCRSVDLRERVNRLVKRREPFRPLAPAVLAEHYDSYFTPPAAENPYMTVVARGTDRCRRNAAAALHIDGSARVQSVGPDGDPFLRRVLIRFHQRTGVPVVLNTSFNGHGEPIVETPDHALAGLLSLGLDALYAEGALFRPTKGLAR